ncbi:BatA domain-containing protein [Sphingomonas sp. RP10(2022)]|uniref:BatA domain-containing protein n=1 Tax=Sphingomonas liriopis TaxID=2949094 RepID=A0A9X2KPI3_9SPHN|nr:BatA domain-containing protein [Sphingomonas liriopis]MCP3734739.1 BatA domain-containing protein [Sphingomonas liriopis]
MNLLFPLGLAALAALALPLLLHLARRTEQRPTDFAALRWLRQKPRPRHRPRFDERLLLAARLALLAVIALVLALPVLTGTDTARAVVAVAPGAAVPPADGARQVWLAPGFPSVTAPRPAGPVPVASLIRQLDAELPPGAALTVVVPRILDGADAERPRVARRIAWRIVGEGLSPPRVPPPALPVLRYDPTVAGARYVGAALRALGQRDIAPRSAPIPRSRPLVWLAPGALPAAAIAQAEAGNIVLVARETTIPASPTVAVWRDADGAALVEAQPLGRGRLLRFTRRLAPAAMPQLLDPDFPHRLAALFAAAEPDPARVLADAYAPQPGAPAPLPPARPLWPMLAVAAALLFLVERWLATRAVRGPAP